MKEFLLLIRTQGDHMESLTPEQRQQHVQKAQQYIGTLLEKGQLKGAQPLGMEGRIISGTPGSLKDGPFNETKEVIAGYFLISANDLDEAMQIARVNPVFEEPNIRIEVRPIKTIEGIND